MIYKKKYFLFAISLLVLVSFIFLWVNVYQNSVYRIISRHIDKNLVLDKGSLQVYSSDVNKIALLQDLNNTIYCFMIRNNKIKTEITVPGDIVNGDGNDDLINDKIYWHLSQKKSEYKFLFGRIFDESISRILIGGLTDDNNEIKLINYRGVRLFFSASFKIQEPVTIEGLSMNGEVLYKNNP